MDATGYGYHRVWRERAYLLKMAIIPLLIKFACTIAVFAMGIEDNFLRQGLVMLPADFAEGWLLAQFLRTLLTDERWPIVLDKMPDERMMSRLLTRARGIVSATLIYVLVSMAGNIMLFGSFAMLGDSAFGPLKDAENRDVAGDAVRQSENIDALGTVMFVPSVLALIGLIWAFRLFWLHIPFSVLMPIGQYLKVVKGFMTSVRMMMLYFCCMSPVMFIAVVLSRSFYGAFGDGGEDMVARFLTILVSSFADLVVALIAVTAMAWSLRDFLPKSGKAFADFSGSQDAK